MWRLDNIVNRSTRRPAHGKVGDRESRGQATTLLRDYAHRPTETLTRALSSGWEEPSDRHHARRTTKKCETKPISRNLIVINGLRRYPRAPRHQVHGVAQGSQRPAAVSFPRSARSALRRRRRPIVITVRSPGKSRKVQESRESRGQGAIKVEQGLFLPLFEPEIPGNPTVVLVDATVASAPGIELAGRDAEPRDEAPGVDLALLGPAPHEIEDLVAHVGRRPGSG